MTSLSFFMSPHREGVFKVHYLSLYLFLQASSAKRQKRTISKRFLLLLYHNYVNIATIYELFGEFWKNLRFYQKNIEKDLNIL